MPGRERVRLDDRRAALVRGARRLRAAGGNFIDTADTYGRRGPGGAGESERIIGRWMAARGNREQLVIATKVGMSPELPGLSEATVRRGAEASLERLGIDRIDLYYAHKDDPDTPLEETLGAFAALIDDGMIRHAAASNYSAERLERGAADRRARGDGLLRGAAAALQPDGARALRGRAGAAVRAPGSRLSSYFRTRSRVPSAASTGPMVERSTVHERPACTTATSTSAASRCSPRSIRSPLSTARPLLRSRSRGSPRSRLSRRRSPAPVHRAAGRAARIGRARAVGRGARLAKDGNKRVTPARPSAQERTGGAIRQDRSRSIARHRRAKGSLRQGAW